MSGDPLQPDNIVGERWRFLSDLLERFKLKEGRRRRQDGEDKARVREEEKRSGRLVGAAETSGELAK